MIKWEDNFIQRKPEECWEWIGPKHRQGYGYHKLTWAHVTDQLEIGSEGTL